MQRPSDALMQFPAVSELIGESHPSRLLCFHHAALSDERALLALISQDFTAA